jgi:hypothetical protein
LSISDKAVYQSVYGLLYVEQKLVGDLINDITAKLIDSDGSGNYETAEVEAFLDAIATAGLSFDLGADLDVLAGSDYVVQDVEIPDVNL